MKKNLTKNKKSISVEKGIMHLSAIDKNLKYDKNVEKMMETILGLWKPHEKTLDTIITLIAKPFLNFLSNIDEKINIEDIKVLSYAIQKLTYCYATIKNVEMRLLEYKIIEGEADLRKKKICETLQVAKERKETLSSETLDYIEENLRFV